MSLSTILQTWLEIDASGRENADLRERYRQALELVSADPDLQLQEHRYLQRAARIVAATLAPTLGERADGFRTELVAGSVVAVLTRLGLQRLGSSGGLPDEDVGTAIRYLEAGMGTLATPQGPGAPGMRPIRQAKRANTAGGSASARRSQSSHRSETR